MYWYPGDDHSGRGEPTAEDAKSLADEHLSDDQKELISSYNMRIVGDDFEAAADIAARVKAGIEKAGDVCKVSPPVCEGNLGIPRDDMPQIMDDPLSKLKDGKNHWKYEAAVAAGANPNDDRPILQQMMEALKEKGVGISQGKIEVGKLMATQAEINGSKALSMAHAQLTGSFRGNPVDLTADPIIVTKPNEDGKSYILDGHHRFAAILMISPDREFNTVQIDMSMPELLDFAADMPGVFRADMNDNVVDSTEKPDYQGYADAVAPKKPDAKDDAKDDEALKAVTQVQAKGGSQLRRAQDLLLDFAKAR